MIIQNVLYRGKKSNWSQRKINIINKVIVHHSGVKQTNKPPLEMLDVHIKNHTQARNWPGFGYHFYIGTTGEIFQVNNYTDIIGSTSNAGANRESVNVMLEGNFNEEQPTKGQLDALDFMFDHLIGELSGVKSRVDFYGHRDMSPSACPGNNLYHELQLLKVKTNKKKEETVILPFIPSEDVQKEVVDLQLIEKEQKEKEILGLKEKLQDLEDIKNSLSKTVEKQNEEINNLETIRDILQTETETIKIPVQENTDNFKVSIDKIKEGYFKGGGVEGTIIGTIASITAYLYLKGWIGEAESVMIGTLSTSLIPLMIAKMSKFSKK